MTAQDSFAVLVEPHRSAIRLHCYRMLGSSHDGDDMVQETLVRAFRARETLENEAAVRPWLYRIATNVCLDELQKRPRRALGPELQPPSDPDAPLATETNDAEWIEPLPGAWLAGAAHDPGAAYALQESVALAFIAALQILTPPQRAVLLLREVIGLSAEETAVALGMSVSAANSALHRARVALEERVGPRGPHVDSPVDRELLARYMLAWQSGDPEAIVSLLHEDATITMPPRPMWLSGREAFGRFLARHISAALRARSFRTISTEANGCPTIAFYRVHDDGRASLFAIHVLELRGQFVTGIHHFMAKSALAAFDLPRIIDTKE